MAERTRIFSDCVSTFGSRSQSPEDKKVKKMYREKARRQDMNTLMDQLKEIVLRHLPHASESKLEKMDVLQHSVELLRLFDDRIAEARRQEKHATLVEVARLLGTQSSAHAQTQLPVDRTVLPRMEGSIPPPPAVPLPSTSSNVFGFVDENAPIDVVGVSTPPSPTTPTFSTNSSLDSSVLTASSTIGTSSTASKCSLESSGDDSFIADNSPFTPKRPKVSRFNISSLIQ